jgi:putative peptide zinc metalloprotease protein
VGDPLIETDDPELRMRVPALEWQLRDLETRRVGALLADRVAAQILQDEIAKVHAELSEAMRRVKDLVIASPAAGRFVVPGAQHLPGRFARQGETLGYVIGSGAATARVVVPESEIGPVRAGTRAVRVRLAQHPGLVLPARIEREVPSASDRLPSEALGTRGGGAVEVDARDEAGLRARSPLFQLDLALPDRGQPYFAGGRVQVLFEHVPKPLGQRWYRRLRQLFLARFQA